MKMKNIILITFLLLAVLTISTASAAEDVASDNITVSDNSEIVAAEDDDDAYLDYDIYANENEEICINVNDEEYNESAEVAWIEMPLEAEGSFQIWNNNNLVASSDFNADDYDEHWDVDEEEDEMIYGTIFLKDLDFTKIHDGDILSFQFFEKGETVPVDDLTMLYKVKLTDSYMTLTEYDEEAEDVDTTYIETEIVMDEGWEETEFVTFTVKEGIDGRIVIYLNNTIAFNKTLSELTEDDESSGEYTLLIGDLNITTAGTYTILDYFYDNEGNILYQYDEEYPETLILFPSQSTTVGNVTIDFNSKPTIINGTESFITISNASADDEILVYINNEGPIHIKLNECRNDTEGNYFLGSKELNMPPVAGEYNLNITYRGENKTGKVTLISNIIIAINEEDIIYYKLDDGFVSISLEEGYIEETTMEGKINLTIMNDNEIIATFVKDLDDLPYSEDIFEDSRVIKTTDSDITTKLNGTYKVIVRYFDGNEANTTAEGIVTFKIFTPEDYGTSINTTIKNKTASIITFKDIPLSEDIIAEIDGNPIDISELIDGDSEEGYYIKYDQLDGLTDGTHSIRVYLKDVDSTELASGTVFVDVEENIDLNLTITVANIEEGNVATVVITTNSNFTGAIAVQIGANNYSVNIVKGQGSIPVSGLKANTYTATALFKSDGIFTDATKAATFTVTAKPAAPSTPAAPAKKVIKLTLKKVKVKKSAKKLVLKATLKINGKAPKKGTKIKFTFKGKKYIGKTNKKGVAKVTIKKKVLKKLKVGKKVKYTAKYSTKTVKRTAKVKR